MDSRQAISPVPLVLITNTEIGGHFQQFSTDRAPLAGVVDTNPESMNSDELHQVAYDVVRAAPDAECADAVDRFRRMRGGGDAQAVVGVEVVVRAAHRGQVDTLLLTEDACRGADTTWTRLTDIPPRKLPQGWVR